MNGTKKAIVLLAVASCSLSQSAQASHLYEEDSKWTKPVVRYYVPRPMKLKLRAAVSSWRSVVSLPELRLSSSRSSRGRADIVIRGSGETWVDCWLPQTKRCVIYVASGTTVRTLVHEVGHSLGFADHVSREVLRAGNHYNAKRYGTYHGVMSYRDFATERAWFGWRDRAMVRRAYE